MTEKHKTELIVNHKLNFSHTKFTVRKKGRISMTLRDSEKQNTNRAHLSKVSENLCFHYFCKQNEIF